MPVLNNLGQTYAKHSVAIFAINVGDSKGEYQSFIQDNDYRHLHWARDSSGDAQRAYKVSAIPVTYILDTAGVIRYVHVGFGGTMDETFAQEIESLLE